MSSVEQLELVLVLLTAALVLVMLARRVHLPPSVTLVLGRMGMGLIPGMPDIELDPDLVLLLFLPPLLVSGAYFTVWRDFRAELRVILQLAVGAVAFTTLVIGLAVHLVLPSLPWAACFTVGAILSPPDAVAAKAVLKGVPLPRRMVTLLEGESLVNDATGLVLFRVAVAAAMSGAFNAWDAVGSFALLSVGGVVVGFAFGQAATFVLARFREPHMVVTGTLLAAWGAYIAGDLLHVSGVLSTVAAGLVFGWKQHEVLPASVRRQAGAVWSVVVFLLESLIFILIGLSARDVSLVGASVGLGVGERFGAEGVTVWSLTIPVLVVFVAMTVARFAWIVPAAYLPRLVSVALRRPALLPAPPFAVPVIMSWAGMRGVVSLAVALSLPAGFPGRDVVLTITFAVVRLSILLQATTLGSLIDWLRLGGSGPETRSTLDEAAARALVAQAALDALRSHSLRPDGSHRHPRLMEQYTYRATASARFSQSAGQLAPDRAEHFQAVLHANHAGRIKLLELHRTARIHDSVLQVIETELDLEELGARQAISPEVE